jgi:hypothetical protein
MVDSTPVASTPVASTPVANSNPFINWGRRRRRR